MVAYANLISGFMTASREPIVIHLQFADNTIIFYEADREEVRNVKSRPS